MAEQPPAEILGDGVLLRAPHPTDADDIVAACADPAVVRFITAIPTPYHRADALEWITDGTTRAWQAGGASFVMADPDTGRLLGATSLHDVNAGRRTGEVGYWVAPWARGHGVATAATVTVSTWAFTRGLYRLELLTEQENWPSQRVAINAGYTREGVRRAGGTRRDGSRNDFVVWSRLAVDPAGPAQRLLPDLPGGALSDGVVRLCPLWTQDAADSYALASLPEEIAATVPPEPPDRDVVAARCARSQSRWLAGERAELTIRDAATGAYAGEIGLFYQEPVSRQAMIGYGLLPQWRGRGLATRAVRLLARWAFQQAGIARLVAGTAPENAGSQRVLERAGFTREGYLRARLPGPAGTRVDDVLYGLLPADLPAD